MTPRILEYEDRRVKVTAEAFAIPEIKAILDKYDMKAEPYLSYIHAMSAIDSPYINIPNEEKQEAVLYDVQDTLGEFNWEDPMVDKAIDKLKMLYQGPMVALALELEQELHRFRKKLKDTPLTMGGEDSNFKDRKDLMKEIGKMASEYSKVKEMAEKELKVATKGDHEVGGYFD